jgi:hypothetical protein
MPRHRRSTDAAAVAVAVVLAVVVVVIAHRATNRAATLSLDRASWTLTPGVANAEVSQASIRSTICVSGWTRSIRPPSSYTSSLKLEQMRAYRRTGSPSDYEEDHLISLELGGDPTDPRNLWPEPRSRAEDVDKVEDELRADICSGRRTLADAQRRISAIKHTAG